MPQKCVIGSYIKFFSIFIYVLNNFASPPQPLNTYWQSPLLAVVQLLVCFFLFSYQSNQVVTPLHSLNSCSYSGCAQEFHQFYQVPEVLSVLFRRSVHRFDLPFDILNCHCKCQNFPIPVQNETIVSGRSSPASFSDIDYFSLCDIKCELYRILPHHPF